MQKSKTLFRIDVGGDYVLKRDPIKKDGGVGPWYEEVGACRRTRLILEDDTDVDAGTSGCEYYVSAYNNAVDGRRGTINRGRS